MKLQIYSVTQNNKTTKLKSSAINSSFDAYMPWTYLI